MITTTLNEILKQDPCGQREGSGVGWDRGLSFLGKDYPMDRPISLLTILESNGFDDALWCLRAVKGFDREIRLFAAWCACNSLKYYEQVYNDTRPRRAVESAILYAEGEISLEEINAAASAAQAAAASAAQAAAASAAQAAASAARAAAGAAQAAASAARAAAGAAWAAAWAAWDAQKEEFIKMCKKGHNYKRGE